MRCHYTTTRGNRPGEILAALNVLDRVGHDGASHAIGTRSISRFFIIDCNVPTVLKVHVISDNYATLKHLQAKGWLARHPRLHLHYITPTYASWRNQADSHSMRSGVGRFAGCAN